MNKKLKEISQKEGSSIIVLKGFDVSSLDLDREKKYFDFSLDKIDKINLEEVEETIIGQIIANREFKEDYKWMTIEEYQLFRNNANINKRPVIMLENNLFDKQYPYTDTLDDVEGIYKKLYFEEESELNDKDQEVLEKVSRIYGKLNKSNETNQYYVTYAEDGSNDKFIKGRYKYYECRKIDYCITDNFPIENSYRIELGDDEIPFLDLENNIILNNRNKDIVLVLSTDIEMLPNNYIDRLSILHDIYNINIFFTHDSMKKQIIEGEKEYVEILNRVFGYNKFKEIEFYQDIENKSKETVKISQVQIIDDIVKQAEKAIDDKSFRDIYITASTGAGKSVMFQIPALYLVEKFDEKKPLTLVISPLIGLMNDQVDNLHKKGIYSAATINGNTPPFEKEKILEGIKNKEIHILYLSPETLQARSDIKMLIGDRKIGMVIIDEAHIVTTWGKSFRADYWYLGIYLAKLRKEHSFPIVTFTATAIYGGKEDMYLDTRNSLNMINPISYFGKVKREDIDMLVKHQSNLAEEGNDYKKSKNVLAKKQLEKSELKNEKTLIYFPTIKLLNEFYNFIIQQIPHIAQKIGKFHGQLNKEEKDAVLEGFKNGKIKYVLATKAFGMGIDIDDISCVYHYAPTGNVIDYIQEIGRAARKENMRGYAVIDFLNSDMNEVKKLHGMSSIRKNQIIEVMSKVMKLYKDKGNNRNMIISSDDFKYIFDQKNMDESTLDNKVKTVLLMIEKDFSSPNKLGFSPFVARPRTLYGNDMIFMTTKLEQKITRGSLKDFFRKKYDITSNKFSSVYEVNLSGIWESYYKTMTFPNFKYNLFNSKNNKKRLRHSYIFDECEYTSAVEVNLMGESIEDILSKYRNILEKFQEFINKYRISGKRFTIIELGDFLKKELKLKDKFEARAFAQTLINSSFEFGKLKDMKFITEHVISDENNKKFIVNQDCDLFNNFIMETLNEALNPTKNYTKEKNKITSFHYRQSISNNSEDIDAKIAALGIGEAMELLNYQIISGNNPQIYIRMNSVYPIEKTIKNRNNYRNNILDDVQKRHYIGVEMLKYLFIDGSQKNNNDHKKYTEWFWNTIEDYFMGIMPAEVEARLAKK